MQHWLVAKVKPNKEASLITMLAQWDVETFYPKIVGQGRRGERLEPLFPTYLFCLVDRMSPLWPRIRWAPGLSYFLGTDSPAELPEDLIAHLRERVQKWNRERGPRDLVHGEQVTVVSGPFAGMDGIFDRYVPARERCQVLLNTVGGRMTVEMPQAGIRPNARPSTALA
jgi:transcriptional antiterminator RfaH